MTHLIITERKVYDLSTKDGEELGSYRTKEQAERVAGELPKPRRVRKSPKS